MSHHISSVDQVKTIRGLDHGNAGMYVLSYLRQDVLSGNTSSFDQIVRLVDSFELRD